MRRASQSLSKRLSPTWRLKSNSVRRILGEIRMQGGKVAASIAALTLVACGSPATHVDPPPEVAAAPARTAQPEPERDTEAEILLHNEIRDLQGRIEELEEGRTALVEALASTASVDAGVVERLKRNGGITLQWIGWDERGTLEVRQDQAGRTFLSGEQRSSTNDDFLKLEGQVVATTSAGFILLGTIEHDVQRLREGGAPRCLRSGAFTFRATGERRYWRLLEMSGRCGDFTDYVDIYF